LTSIDDLTNASPNNLITLGTLEFSGPIITGLFLKHRQKQKQYFHEISLQTYDSIKSHK
jgi:hypothetical protein